MSNHQETGPLQSFCPEINYTVTMITYVNRQQAVSRVAFSSTVPTCHPPDNPYMFSMEKPRQRKDERRLKVRAGPPDFKPRWDSSRVSDATGFLYNPKTVSSKNREVNICLLTNEFWKSRLEDVRYRKSKLCFSLNETMEYSPGRAAWRQLFPNSCCTDT